MFYLTYRPQTIAEIDNSIIREQFNTLLKTKSIPHALLLTGPKGTGKTSTARIIAKAINCENNLFSEKSTSIEPCNTCDNCKSITSGSSIDIIEIDAASNRKIDEIRNLIEKIHFLPVSNRYKVYIIDEIHMLTKEAFNALLKTLEEPPAATIFILATTEINKLPKTIQSRCIQFTFQRANIDDVVHMLHRICLQEKIAIDDKVLMFIAKHCDGSFRDAAKVFEQAVMQKALTVPAIQQLIGLGNRSIDLLKLIEEKKLKDILTYLSAYEKDGGDFKTLIETELDSLHALLLKKNGVDTGVITDYNVSIAQISKLVRLFQEAYNALKYSPIESLPLEIAIVEYFSTAT